MNAALEGIAEERLEIETGVIEDLVGVTTPIREVDPVVLLQTSDAFHESLEVSLAVDQRFDEVPFAPRLAVSTTSIDVRVRITALRSGEEPVVVSHAGSVDGRGHGAASRRMMCRMGRTAIALIVLALLLGACSGGEANDEREIAPSPTETDDPSPTVTVTETVPPTPEPTGSEAVAACPNEETVAPDETLRQPGVLSGDLEDDGVADDVYLAVDRSGEPGCQAFVVVQSGDAVRSAPVEVMQIPFEMGFPRLIGLPLIDDRPGAEIVIGVGAGASTQFAAVFTSLEGQLVPVLREGAPNLEASLLAFGGSVGHQDAFDCAPEAGEGAVVVSSAEADAGGARFSYVRRFFLPQGDAVYAEDESLREEGTIRFNRFGSLHEFPNAPFGSCPSGQL
jgi:hypothetical protein